MGVYQRTVGHFLPFARPEKATFRLDTAVTGGKVTETAAYRRADVIHLHWINQGLLSLDELERILRDGKNGRVDDARHLARDRYLSLGIVLHELPPILRNMPLSSQRRCAARSLSSYMEEETADLFDRHPDFRGVQSLVADEARSASLTRGQTVSIFPTQSTPPSSLRKIVPPLVRNSDFPQILPCALSSLSPSASRISTRHALFGGSISSNISHAIRNHHHNTALFILGGEAEEFRSAFDVPVFTTPYTYDVETIVRIYNAANLFVLPSISENLPNTIMEALACGIPCLGFRIGGIPEMIDHERNGYVAAAKDAEDLSAGLHYLLDLADPDQLSASRS